MKRRKKGITAGILALATVISSVQVTLYAAGEEIRSINVSDSYGSEKARDSEVNANPEYTDGKSDKESYESIPYIIGENEELRGENEKHFRLSDGSEIAAMYTNPVHYQENGEWKEYDHTLVSGMNGYIPAGDNMGVCFSSDPASDEIFSFNKDEHSISMSVHKKDVKYSGEASVSVPALPFMYSEEMGQDLSSSGSEDIYSTAENPVSVSGREAFLYDAINPVLGGTKAVRRSISAARASESFVYDVKSTKEAVNEFKLANPGAGEKEIAEAAEKQNQINEEQRLEILNSPVNTGVIRYGNMIDGAALEYTVGAGYIKENIILTEPGESYEYSFEFDTELAVVPGEDGSVSFCDGEEVIFWIPAPYMYDADGNTSDKVSYSVEVENGNKVLTVKADSEWIEAKGRAFPVTIDPTLISKGYNTGVIRDGYVQERGSGGEAVGNLYTGYSSYQATGGGVLGRRRVFWRITSLPTIPESSIVVNSTVNIMQHLTGGYSYTGSASSTKLGMYEVTGEWDSQIGTWSSQPTYSQTLIDYAETDSSKNGSFLTWDITKLAKKWYSGGANYGVAILPAPEYNGGSSYASVCLVSSKHGSYYTEASPAIVVVYRDNKGTEDYWTAQSQSVGAYSTAYVNDYNSQITLMHEDISYPSEVLPFTLYHVFNSSYCNEVTKSNYPFVADSSNMPLGTGWKLNVMESVTPTTISGTRYLVYNDSDGTDHYFYPKDGAYHDEDGLGLKITESGTTREMTDKKGNRKVFINGILSYTVDQNNNKLIMSYNTNEPWNSAWNPTGTDDRLAAIFHYDPASDSYIRIALLNYGSTNGQIYLANIQLRNGDYVYYYYDLNNSPMTLYRINHSFTGGGNTYFEYNWQNKMSSVYDEASDYGVRYLYDSGRINEIAEYYKQPTKTFGNIIHISGNSAEKTEYTYEAANAMKAYKNVYLFDYAGRTVNTYTENRTDGTVYGAAMGVYSDESVKTKNKLAHTSETGVPAVNYFMNPGNEIASDTTSWINHSNAEVSGYIARTGQYSRKITNEGGFSQTMYMQAGTYTFSAYLICDSYISFGSGGGVYLEIQDGHSNFYSSEKITERYPLDNGWQRVTLTVDISQPGWHTFVVWMMGGSGCVYADDMQLEVGAGAGSANLLHNGSFEGGVSGWSGTTLAVTDSEKKFGSVALKIDIEDVGGAYQYQYVPVNSSPEITYVLSGWAKAESVAIDYDRDAARAFRLMAEVVYTDGSSEAHTLDFNTDITEWQFVSKPIVPKSSKTVKGIGVYIQYFRNANTAYFDGISLIRENVQTYKYDSNGNVTACNNTAKLDTSLTYDSAGINLISATQPGSGSYSYTYDSKNNISSVSADGVTDTIVRHSRGNVTATALGNGYQYKLESTAYYADYGNFVAGSSDCNGVDTYYAYNNELGLLKAQMVNGRSSVSYSYDGRRLKSLTSGGLSPIVYEYTRTYISSIKRTDDAHTYTFEYDSFGNLTAVKYGGSTLVTYTYVAGNGNLLRIDYSNGDAFVYAYDELDRIKQIGNNYNVVYKCVYDNSGNICKIYDGYSKSGTEAHDVYTYEYDSLGRAIRENKYSGTEKVSSKNLTYDSAGRISKNEYSVDGTKGYWSSVYDSGGKVTQTSLLLPGASVLRSLKYQYDELNRPLFKTLELIPASYSYGYSYKALSDTRTTMNICKVDHRKNGNLRYYNYYMYNGNNITSVIKGTCVSDEVAEATYGYDTQNQLRYENNRAANASYEYIYDAYGNITSVKQGTYGSLPENTVKTFSYSGDKLTNYNGSVIYYDSTGNPRHFTYNDYGYNLSWEDGRRLSSTTVNTVTTDYRYNADGIRTQKGDIQYIVDGARILAEKRSDRTIYYLYDESGDVVGFTQKLSGGAVEAFYYVKKLQGDVTELLNYKLDTVAVYSYNAWGEMISVTDSSGNAITDMNHIANINPFRYRSYYYDTETGFYYCGSRYYNPVFCRWINADGYASTGQGLLGHNMYAYCENDPVNHVDSDGEFAIAIGVGVTTALKILGGAAATVMLVDTLNDVCQDVYEMATHAKKKSLSKAESKEKDITINPKFSAPTYYQITTMDTALKIKSSNILLGNKWEAGLVFAWRKFPNKYAQRYSGAHFGVIISFKTGTAFIDDNGIEDPKVRSCDPVVSARPGPIAVWDVQILEVIG